MSKCKIFALYLPQFHRTKENDEWWGEGFTEWNSVKVAKKLSKYSRQPRVPMEGYYDLSEIGAIKRQAELANEYGVDGFAIYHYYSNGTVLLGTPAKLLNENKEINIEYFFSWANHDWRRTWYGYNMEILQKQEYGNEQQIIQHYEYLREYFLDDRYYKIDNKPVLSIYKPSYIPNLEMYKEIWNMLAKKDGFNGIYLIQTIDTKQGRRNEEVFDAAFNFEPGHTINSNNGNRLAIISKVRSFLIKRMNFKIVSKIWDYNHIARKMILKVNDDNKQYYGAFAGWDNTPRHKYMGSLYKNESTEMFYKLLKSQYIKATNQQQEMLVINAWNEWSEGAYLEADTDEGYSRLEVIQRVKQEG